LALSPGGAFVLRAPHHVHEIGLGTA
jgi:hypothetical protein